MTESVPKIGCGEGELQAAGPRRGATGRRIGTVPVEEDLATLPPCRPDKDVHGSAFPEGRVPDRHYRRGLLRTAQGRLPDVL